VDEREAALAISRADEAIKAAYGAVVEAEKAGGDVSALASELNRALDGFSAGKMAFDSGQYDVVATLAQNAIDVADRVSGSAVELKATVKYVGEMTFKSTLILSAGLIFVVIYSGFFWWWYFKAYYVRNVPRLRPEVSADEPG
jgi:hypothetical protein